MERNSTSSMRYKGAEGSYLIGTWRVSWQIAQVSVLESARAEGSVELRLLNCLDEDYVDRIKSEILSAALLISVLFALSSNL